MKPITPSKAKKDAKSNIPDFVIEGVNNAIKLFYCKDGFTILQKDIMIEVCKLKPDDITTEIIFKNNWLDFEDIFREAGWYITFHKPAYNDLLFEPNFKFKEKENTVA